jgi:aspartyl-tRNA(Asn)/glutamyl-tRNA(Gln) amidotransferase subunit C
MAASLSPADVERVAALARLELTDPEKRMLTKQLAEILAFASEVQQLDTSGVAATSHVLAPHPASRLDEAWPSLTRAEALANAPDADEHAGLFRVPRVIG